MASVDELINKGLVLSGRQMERGRIFIVTGLYRSGTSLVDSIPQRTGRFMGGQINDVVSPEEELFSILEQLPARPEQVIRVHVARHGVELDNSGKTVRELRRGS